MFVEFDSVMMKEDETTNSLVTTLGSVNREKNEEPIFSPNHEHAKDLMWDMTNLTEVELSIS